MSSTARKNPVVVLDCGTAYSKLGYSGNRKPDFIIPSCIYHNTRKRPHFKEMHELDFCIGHEACGRSEFGGFAGDGTRWPLKNGIITKMNLMELFWEQVFFKYLRCLPDDHFVMLSDPPLNPPEKREEIAEVMFETFNVGGLFFGAQSVLALAASSQTTSTTGLVVDSGEGVTKIVPVVDGNVISSAIKHFPVAGRHVTRFIRQFAKDREKMLPDEKSEWITNKIKKEHCYTAKDIVREFRKYDSYPECYVNQFEFSSRGRKCRIDIGPERFLGPEIFFNPELLSFENRYLSTLPELVDQTILGCPIDNRRALYLNIVLSGGSTSFKNFDRRLRRELQKVIDERVEYNQKLMRDPFRVRPIEINVIASQVSSYSVWFGGSMLAAGKGFASLCKTRDEYKEKGPSCCRVLPVFTSLT